MTDFAFDISWEHAECANPLESATFGSLTIRVDGSAITEVHDHLARTTRSVIRVAAYPLALWLASNWWRLRWEPRRDGEDWELSHQLGAAGAGYAWPAVTFVSDGEAVAIEARRVRTKSWEPVTYLTSGTESVSAGIFEVSVREFVEGVLARLAEAGSAGSDLAQMWSDRQRELRDPRVAASRRLEALLGFDPDEAPAELLTAYARGAEKFGDEAVAELAAATTDGPPPDWEALDATLDHGVAVRVRRLGDLVSAARRSDVARREPWQRGEEAARAVRRAIGHPSGALTDAIFREWVETEPADSVAEAMVSPTPRLHAALGRRHHGPQDDQLRIVHRSAHLEGRRFELARVLGDHLVAADPRDRLLPATRAATARQRVQRAFAAELLVPWADLAARVGQHPDMELVELVAREYGVSPLLVQTRLVTKGRLAPDALDVDWPA